MPTPRRKPSARAIEPAPFDTSPAVRLRCLEIAIKRGAAANDLFNATAVISMARDMEAYVKNG